MVDIEKIKMSVIRLHIDLYKYIFHKDFYFYLKTQPDNLTTNVHLLLRSLSKSKYNSLKEETLFPQNYF